MKDKELSKPLDLTKSEKDDLNRILGNIREMRNLRNKKLGILNELTVNDKIEQNLDRHIGYNYAKPERHKWKSDVKGRQSMTKHSKLVSLLLAENLGPVVKAYDNDYDEHKALSRAWTSVVRKTNDIEDLYQSGDAETILDELLRQGTVFVEEIYEDIEEVHKDFVFDPTNLDKMKGSLKEKKNKRGVVYKRVLNARDVYLGSHLVEPIQDQPYIAVRVKLPWGKAREIYGDWERWQYVERNHGKTVAELEDEYTKYDTKWYSMSPDKENSSVEIVKYMERGNTYQILINGVPMLPPNTGFPWGYNKYNITKQILYKYDTNFPYGMSIYDILGPDQEIYDRTMSYIMDRNRQIIDPSVALLNSSVRAVNLFKPSTVHRGLDPEDVKVMTPKEGLGASSWNVVQHFEQSLDKLFSPTTMGTPLTGEHSATEVAETQKNSMKILGFLMLAYKKIIRDTSWLRIMNIINNCIKPVGTKKYESLISSEFLSEYQEYIVSDAMLHNGKKGKLKVRFIPKEDQEKVLRSEVSISEGNLAAAEKLGFKRIEVLLKAKSKTFDEIYDEIMIDPNNILDLHWFFYIISEPMSVNTTQLERAEFKESLIGAINAFGPERINFDFWMDKYADMFDLSEEAFSSGQAKPLEMAEQIPGKPSAEGGDGRVVQQQSKDKPTNGNQVRSTIKGMNK